MTARSSCRLVLTIAALVASECAVQAQTPATRPSSADGVVAGSKPTTRPYLFEARVGVAPASSPASQPVSASQPAVVLAPLPIPDGARQAVEKLSSGEERERRRASEALVRMGPAVKPLLDELIAHGGDLETITRARAALSQIEEDRLIGPSYVTLHVKDAEPRLVAAELSRQCYAELKPMPDNLWDDLPAKVSIDVDRVPFWVAMQQFTAQTGLTIQQYNDGFRLMRGGQPLGGPSTVHGAFMTVAQQMTRIQVVQLVAGQNGQPAQAAAANGRGDFNLQMLAVAEPKLEVVRSNMSIHVTEAVDDNGNSLLIQGPDNRGFFGSSGRFWNLVARLNWPAKNPGKRIAHLRATATFTIQTKVQRLEIPDPLHMKDHAEVVGGVPVTLRSLTKTGDNCELKLSVSTDALGGSAWVALQQTLQTKLHLVDAHGVQFDHRGFGTSGGQNEITFTMQFAGGQLPIGTRVGEADKLIWEVPLETRDVNVPIAFDDLPMPQ